MGPYRYLLPPTTLSKTKLHSTDPYAIIHEGGVEMERELEKMNSADLCNRASNITALCMGPAQGPQKLNAFKLCLVHSKPLLELNSDLH